MYRRLRAHQPRLPLLPPPLAQVDIVEQLCRKYNRTAMALLETRAYAQARELLQKAQVRAGLA